ncbi:unnamed protein product [Trichobilharzia szidati]|nr:unnamed protein product [Trichobilharzia szidati]
MLSLGLKFTPCDIGETEHQGSIVFYSEKLTEWCFTLCGKGLMPQPKDPINVSVLIGSATTLVVPITNPFKYDVLLDVHLSESTLCGLFKQLEDTHNAILKKKFNNVPPNSNDDSKENINGNLVETNECNCDDDGVDKSLMKPVSKPINGNVYSAFQLLVKQQKNILLTSKTVFEIPISFAPLEMREHEALCTVRMYKANSAAHDTSKTATSISPIRWLIPIKGIPEMKSLTYPSTDMNEFISPYSYNYKNSFTKPLVITGTVRSKSYFIITLRLLNSLTQTLDPSLSFRDQLKDIEVYSVTSQEEIVKLNEQMFSQTTATMITDDPLSNQSTTLWDQIQVGSLEWTMKPIVKKVDEYLAQLVELDKVLMRSLNIKLIGVKKHDDSEMTEINLGMIFSPAISFKCSADLMVRSCLGAIWRFGLLFRSNDPPVDDIIYFPHNGIGRSVKVQLALSSQTNEPTRFIARLYPENQTEYTVEPMQGELPPTKNIKNTSTGNDSALTITFKPNSYGKPIKARLLIQVRQ